MQDELSGDLSHGNLGRDICIDQLSDRHIQLEIVGWLDWTSSWNDAVDEPNWNIESTLPNYVTTYPAKDFDIYR